MTGSWGITTSYLVGSGFWVGFKFRTSWAVNTYTATLVSPWLMPLLPLPLLLLYCTEGSLVQVSGASLAASAACPNPETLSPETLEHKTEFKAGPNPQTLARKTPEPLVPKPLKPLTLNPPNPKPLDP